MAAASDSKDAKLITYQITYSDDSHNFKENINKSPAFIEGMICFVKHNFGDDAEFYLGVDPAIHRDFDSIWQAYLFQCCNGEEDRPEKLLKLPQNPKGYFLTYSGEYTGWWCKYYIECQEEKDSLDFLQGFRYAALKYGLSDNLNKIEQISKGAVIIAPEKIFPDWGKKGDDHKDWQKD